MEKFKKIETEVEQFLPNYFLPEEEQMQVVPETVVPLLLGVVCAGVCGLSFFLWMTTFSGNSVVAGSMNKTHETTVAGKPAFLESVNSIAQAGRLQRFSRHNNFSLELSHVTHSNN